MLGMHLVLSSGIRQCTIDCTDRIAAYNMPELTEQPYLPNHSMQAACLQLLSNLPALKSLRMGGAELLLPSGHNGGAPIAAQLANAHSGRQHI